MSSSVKQPALRRVRVNIDLQALKYNLQRVRDFAPDCSIMAVVKANGYGHGMLSVARALDLADMFAVATPAEAIYLRRHGINKPLVVLQGFSKPAELMEMSEYEIDPVIHQDWQIDWLEEFQGGVFNVWLKIDTGMHRLGLPLQSAVPSYNRLNTCSSVASITLMSHFANADDVNNIINNNQIDSFVKVISDIGAQATMANSAAIMALPDSHFDIVRPGIMLYGSSPFLNQSASQLNLRSVMSMESELVAIRQLEKGDSIGYGSEWNCPEAMNVGIVGAGYGDGYPRKIRAGTPVWLNNKRCEILGRVSMDSLCVDLRNVEADIGDRVVLWGKELPVDEIAQCAGTIAYELLCKAGSMNYTQQDF